MINELRKGGRKANATLLVMVILTVIYLLQFPQIATLLVLDYKEVCLDMTYINMLPRMSTTEYSAAMVTLIGLFGASNAYTYNKQTTDEG
jgi:hypothetical protein